MSEVPLYACSEDAIHREQLATKTCIHTVELESIRKMLVGAADTGYSM